MANLKRIVNINIDIKTPAISTANFDNLLIVGPAPAITPEDAPYAVGSYSDLEGVTGAGWVATGNEADPVGIAARIAFSQNPQPAKIFIAVQQKAAQLLAGVRDATIITNDNWSDLLPAGEYTEAPSTLPWIQFGYSRSECDRCIVAIRHNDQAWTKEVPASENPDAFVTALLGIPSRVGEDALGLAPADFVGEYDINITAYKGDSAARATVSLSFDGTTSTATTPVIPNLEPIEATLNRALGTSGWYVTCPAGIAESEFETIAEWTEAQIKLFAFTYTGETCPVGAIYYRSFGYDGKTADKQILKDVPTSNLYLNVAAVAKCLAYPSGSETWKFKQLAAVYPSNFSSTKSDRLEAAHLNYYAEYGGRNITMNGQVMAGEWIDVIRFRDWLQDDMQFRIYNLLIMNTKVPFTNKGIALVENQMIASLKAGQSAGGVAEDEYDNDGVLIPGFTVTVPNSMALSASQKASRILSGCKFSARLAGAIHAVTVNGELTY